jgi:hypothetical protein
MKVTTRRSGTLIAMVAVCAVGLVGVTVAGGDDSSPSAVEAATDPGDKHAVRAARAHTAAEEFPTAQPAGQFTAITPYRAWDTRINESREMVRGDDVTVDMLTDFQNVPQIPSTATAITFNVTVTDTESTFGFVTVFNGDAAAIPGTSTLNWVLPAFTIANGGTVALGAPGSMAAGAIGIAMDGAPDAAAEVIVDVTGYYTP